MSEATIAATNEGGLGILRRVLTAVTPKKNVQRHMQIVETLALGPKKQLMLVSCDGERFLVGTGADSVQTIVRVAADGAGA